MVPLFKWFMFLFSIYNGMGLLNGLDMQPKYEIPTKKNSTNEHEVGEVFNEIFKIYGKGSSYQDGAEKLYLKNKSENETSSKNQVVTNHHANKTDGDHNVKDFANKQDIENVHEGFGDKIIVQPPRKVVTQSKDIETKGSASTPSPMTNNKESNGEFNQASDSKQVEHNTKDVKNLNDNPSERENESVREIGEWTGSTRSDNTELATVGSTGASLLCIENVCNFLTYMVMFITPYYYNVGLYNQC